MDKTGMKKISRAAKTKKRARLLLFVIISLLAVVLAAVAFNMIFKQGLIDIEIIDIQHFLNIDS